MKLREQCLHSAEGALTIDGICVKHHNGLQLPLRSVLLYSCVRGIAKLLLASAKTGHQDSAHLSVMGPPVVYGALYAPRSL